MNLDNLKFEGNKINDNVGIKINDNVGIKINDNVGGHNCINIHRDELIEAPFKTNDSTNPDSNNGLITSIWGPPEWESFHSFTFGFPIKPTEEQKLDYLN